MIKLNGLVTLGITNVTVTIISGVFWFYVAALIGAESYGEISYFISIAAITGVLASVGMSNTLVVFTAKDLKIQSASYFISLISGVITSITVFFIFYNFSVSIYVLGYVIFTLASSELLGRKLYKNYSKYLITQRLLLVVLSLSLYFVIGPNGIILGYALSFFPFIIRIVKGFREAKIEFSKLKSKIGFIFNSYGLDLSEALSRNIDKLVVFPLFGFTLLGNYQLGVQVLMVMTIIPTTVYEYVLPQNASGKPHIKLKFVTVGIAIILALLGIFLAPIILPILFPNFEESSQIVQIISIAIIPVSISLMYKSKFLGVEKSKIVLIGAVIFVVAQIVAIILLSDKFGINGVAGAFVIAAASRACFLVIVDKKEKFKKIDEGI